ncbi:MULTISPECIES: hypothetical protein [unclassified Roseofilum]|nr:MULTISPECIES: hypothetical protein [unclassified Roseofilum]
MVYFIVAAGTLPNFPKFGQQPKILIVTQKLLTGFDAPILYFFEI